ncbi:MAG: hypothetical protein MN733_03875 [Nitrososphaera sp.]|nr:hypothetical protein [Nitrososphaera sp.]
MSVDVFGRQLDKSASVSTRGPPGPPGVGFKFTADGQYDIDNKRLCNVDNPMQQNDAVTLSFVQRQINALLVEIRNNNQMIRSLQSRVTEALRKLDGDVEAGQDLPIRNSTVIRDLDARLTTLENERAKSIAREGAA